jgi:hypothetical protein
MGLVLGCLGAATAFCQSASQFIFAKTVARLAEDDSLRQRLSFSYTLHLTGTLYQKDDSAQVIEAWRIAQDEDSVRVQLLSQRLEGKTELAKKYKPPVEIKPAKRGENPRQEDPLMGVTWELLSWIQQDSKAHLMIDGKTTSTSGNLCYVVKFLANDRIGSLWVNAQTAALEHIEWAHGKSFGVISSGENSVIELAPVAGASSFPVKLIFNERSRKLLRRTGAYTEIEIRDFHRETIQ